MCRSFRGGLGRPRARTRGGYSLWLFFWAFQPLSCTPRGPLFRANSTGSGRIFHPCIRLSCSVLRKRGSDRTPAWFPAFLPFSAAFLILWAPGGFRITCYYYRGAYYKAFWADPPNCAVGEPRKTYLGERSFPLIIQNIHRYFMYLAVIFIGLLAKDAWDGFAGWPDGFHVNVGTLVLTINVILLGSYTFGCHSLRHLIGGISDVISKSPIRKKAYDCVSCLNARHMRFAWFSLFWVGFSDLYVRMCAMGIWTDWRFF